jgi:hypothetical protein
MSEKHLELLKVVAIFAFEKRGEYVVVVIVVVVINLNFFIMCK